MTEILLLVIAITLLYIAWKIPKNPERKKEEADTASRKEALIVQQLPALKGKFCEFTAKDLNSAFDYGLSGKGTVVDFDDVWVLLATHRTHDVGRRVRIADLSEVIEVREH